LPLPPGNAAFQAGDYEGALRLYAAALPLDPASAALYNNRALCLLRLGRARQAVSEAQQGVLLEPRQAKGWVRLGDAYAARGGVQHLQVVAWMWFQL
jgi:tetratricopeptide (TPR) repeat protein